MLAKKFGKKFTTNKLSPIVSGPRPPKDEKPKEALPDGDCDGDGAKNKNDGDDDNDGLTDSVELSLGLDPCVADTDEDGVLDKWEFDCDRDAILNRDESDDDDDLLTDDLETLIGTNPCAADSDADSVPDGYEFRSAVDLNDDEFQHPNTALPYPGKKPYANPLFPDAGVDYDGDSLTLSEEYLLWVYTYSVTKTDPRDLNKLSYSDGMQYTRSQVIPGGTHAGRHEPTLPRAGYDKHQQFVDWATAPATARCCWTQRAVVEPRRRPQPVRPVRHEPRQHGAGERRLRRQHLPGAVRRPHVRGRRPSTSTSTRTSSCPTTSVTRTPTASRTTTRPTAA